MRCFPTQHGVECFVDGDADRGHTGTARSQFGRDLGAGYALRRIDDFQDRVAAAVADVEGFAGNAVDLLKRADVGIGDIEYVDVIAEASSVRCGIVRAEDIDMGQSTASGVENPRNEMSLHAMMLAAFLGGSGSVEVAEGHVLEPGVELVIRENLFEYELGFTVGVDGRFAMVFGDGNDFGFAVSGRRRGKNEFLYAVAGGGIERMY